MLRYISSTNSLRKTSLDMHLMNLAKTKGGAGDLLAPKLESPSKRKGSTGDSLVLSL